MGGDAVQTRTHELTHPNKWPWVRSIRFKKNTWLNIPVEKKNPYS